MKDPLSLNRWIVLGVAFAILYNMVATPLLEGRPIISPNPASMFGLAIGSVIGGALLGGAVHMVVTYIRKRKKN